MPSPTDIAMPAVPSDRRITASHLYDFAVCDHRVALDFWLPRDRRAPVDAVTRRLFERGRELEARIAKQLGYVIVPFQPDDFAAAHRQTVALMKEGVPGIYQGVLADERRLAIPDLLRRAEGASSLGTHHYLPGDIKSGMKPRTDQVLQVAFAALLLEAIQGRRPETGFLVFSGGTEAGHEESFGIDDVADSAVIALRAVEAIAAGRRATLPFLSDGCARCRWREVCTPELLAGPDPSLIAGMTRTRQRLLAGAGVRTIPELLAREASETLPAFEGLPSLLLQARALVTGTIIGTGRRRGRKPTDRTLFQGSEGSQGSDAREHLLVAARDPLGDGEPFLFAWSARASSGATHGATETWLAGDRAARGAVARKLAERFGEADEPIFHFGRVAPRAFERIADEAGLPPALQGKIEARFFDLAPLVRNGIYLPVRRYRLAEVAAALGARPAPAPVKVAEDEEAPFLWFEAGKAGDEEALGRLMAFADRQIADLSIVRDAALAEPGEDPPGTSGPRGPIGPIGVAGAKDARGRA